eukprot:2051439-Amphidinium_carterae.3
MVIHHIGQRVGGGGGEGSKDIPSARPAAGGGRVWAAALVSGVAGVLTEDGHTSVGGGPTGGARVCGGARGWCSWGCAGAFSAGGEGAMGAAGAAAEEAEGSGSLGASVVVSMAVGTAVVVG